MSEMAEQDTPPSPQWVAAHANALLYEVLSNFVPVGGGTRASCNVNMEQCRRWREQAIHLSDIAAHPDYGRASDSTIQSPPMDPPCHDLLDECLPDDPLRLTCHCGTPVVARYQRTSQSERRPSTEIEDDPNPDVWKPAARLDDDNDQGQTS